MMADTNATTTSSAATATNGTSGETVPQWKKELLQRRKNLAKTIGAASVPVHDSASAVAAALTTPTTPKAAGPPFGGPPSPGSNGSANSSTSGQKDPSGEEATCSSPTTAAPTASSSDPLVALVDNPSSTNRDSPASPTAFGTPVFVGHSPSSSPGNEPPQQQVLVKSASGRPTNTAATRESSSTVPGVLHAAGATSAGEKQPLCTQSHSNDGTESTIGSRVATNSSSPVGKYAAAAGGTGISGSVVVECELARPAAAASAPASGETNSYSSSGSESWKLKKNTSSASSSTVSPNASSSSSKMVAASAEEIIYEKNRFVGPAGATTTTVTAGVPGEVDPSEELKYGPGIVSKLRCRYLSLALRQSANKQRPSLNSMRRATSLNNLLDEESEDLSERETSIEAKDHAQDKGGQQQYHGKLGSREREQNQLNLQQQHLLPHQQKAKTPDEYISTFQKSVQNSYTRSGRQTEKKNEYNRYNKQRGADSLKRARSVEALVRYDHKAWERDIQKENLYSSNDSNVIILDEICATNGTTNNNNNANNANNIANNCQQTVAMNKAAAELIVDCVTIEEKIINGREKGDPKPKRLTSFIDADERPPPDVVRQTMKIFEANANRRGRPVARTNGAAGEVAAKVASYKSIISQEKPPITHPKPPLSPKKPNIIPRTTSPKSNGQNTATNGKPPTLPKLDLNVIRTSLETTNNLKNSANTTPTSTPTPPIQNNNATATSTPLSVRVEPPSTYRLKYESPALSPNATSKVTTTHSATNRAESPRFSTTTTAAAASALPASMQNNTNSTAHTFVDSPSIQALTSKLNCLNVATSTPTSTRSPTPSDPAAAAPPQAPPRGVVASLQYEDTSDEDDPDDPEDQQREYSINSDRGSDSQPDDLELDESAEEDEPDTSKTVSRAAMDNIAKAGVTTQFRFNGGGGAQNKSHLPGAKPPLSSNSSSTSSSPITVPAVVTAAKPPVPLSRESLSATNGGLKSNSISSSVTANNHSNSLNNHSSNANTSVNSINNGSKLVINDTASAPPHPPSSDAVKSLTAREIEKNQINLEKSGEDSAAPTTANTPVVVVPPHSSSSEKVKNNNSAGSDNGAATATGGDFFMAKWGSSAPTAAATTASPLVPLVKKKVKAPPPPIEANTMVFNFSDRKDVPDYIENDGIILRPRPRELPKPGESGFVMLGDLTLETSTDPDDSWAMGPPSPCDVEFANANIVINGKSSMRNKTSRDSKFKIQFDDSLTSTFEYPSETSLLETNGFESVAAAAADRTTQGGAVDAAANNGQPPSAAPDTGLLSHKNTLLSSMPLGSAPFASYTPVKAAIDTTFELGVTRTPSPSASSNSSTVSNEVQNPAAPPSSHHHHHHNHHSTNGGGMITGSPRINGLNGGSQQQQQDNGEPESIQYLKPASDEQTVNWSQGTRVTDLLF